MEKKAETIELTYWDRITLKQKIALGLFVFAKLHMVLAMGLLFSGYKILSWVILGMAAAALFSCLGLCFFIVKEERVNNIVQFTQTK